jgi:hypothetical protein
VKPSPNKKKTKPTSTNLEWEEIKPLPMQEKRCDHRFQFVEEGECKCRKCGMGLIGVIDIMNGRPV